MAQNTAKFEESAGIIVDSAVEAAAAGWALNYSSINRVGNLVAVHVEATNNANAAALVATLQRDFAPADVVTDSTGNFTIDASGNVSFNGSRVAGAKRVLNVHYQAGSISP